ncbi:MAG: hypothetical protein PHW27_13535, partial [Melioribacteraceae bacterium]|nr:hypothetical protein [Melioribacteraceae bacterium]
LHSQNNINLHFGINSSSTNQNELNRGLSLGPLVKAGWNIYFFETTGVQLNSGMSWNRNHYNGPEAAILIFYHLNEKIQILGGVNFHKNLVVDFSGGMTSHTTDNSTVMINLAANYNFYKSVWVQFDMEFPLKNVFRETTIYDEEITYTSEVYFVSAFKLVFVL